MPQSAEEYLASHQLLTLATASKDGRPHAAPNFYASDGLSLYFSFSPESESARNLAQNPVAAVGVADVPEDWTKASGIQMTGRVHECDDEEDAQAQQLFLDRYPFLGDGAVATQYWRFDPEEVHYVHNDQGGDEDLEALGVHWMRETVQPDQS